MLSEGYGEGSDVNRPSLPFMDLLARRATAGSSSALCELCDALSPIAEALASKHAGIGRYRGLERDDIRQEAMRAMLEALRDWDPTRAAFRTHAFGRARYAVLDQLNGGHLVSVPKNAREVAAGRYKSTAMAERTRAAAIAATSARPASLDADPGDDEKGRYPAWAAETERGYEEVMTRLVLEQAHRRASHMLTEAEKEALTMFYEGGMVESDIGPAMGVTKQRGRMMRLSGLAKLRAVNEGRAIEPVKERGVA